MSFLTEVKGSWTVETAGGKSKRALQAIAGMALAGYCSYKAVEAPPFIVDARFGAGLLSGMVGTLEAIRPIPRPTPDSE